MDIEIPDTLTEPLMIAAAEQENSVEEIVERAIKNYIERNNENAVRQKERDYCPN